MYICSICNKTFDSEESIAKHSLKCWREKNPNHKSTPAPRSADIVERTINNDVLSFFSSIQKGN